MVACICHSPLHHQKPDFEGQSVVKTSSYLLPFVLEAHRESLPCSCETSARRLSAESAEVYSTADLPAINSAAHTFPSHILITEVHTKWNLHPDEKRKYPKAKRRAPHKQQRDGVRAAQSPAINLTEFMNPRTHRTLVYVPLLLGLCLRRCRSSRTCQSVAVHGSSAQSIACSCIYSTTV